MLTDRGGLSTSQVSSLFALWVCVALASEIPTGLIGDRFKRKYVLLASNVMTGVGFATWLLSPSYWGYLFGFFMWGVGWALMSGTYQAYLFERLRDFDRTHEFMKMFSRAASVTKLGMFTAFLLTFFLGAREYNVALTCSLISLVFSSLLLSVLPTGEEQEHERKHPLGEIKQAFRIVWSTPQLRYYTVVLSLLSGILAVIEEYAPLYYVWQGIDQEWIPLLLALGLLLSAALSWVGHLVDALPWRVLMVLLMSAGFVLYFSSSAEVVWVVVGMLFFFRVIAVLFLILEARLQHELEDDALRATASSIPTFLAECIAIVLFGVSALLSSSLEGVAVVRMIAILVLLLGGVFFFYRSSSSGAIRTTRG